MSALDCELLEFRDSVFSILGIPSAQPDTEQSLKALETDISGDSIQFSLNSMPCDTAK